MTTRVNKRIYENRRVGPGLDLVALGRRIRELRGFDTEQKEFARLLGVSQSQLSKYERGESSPPLELLAALAQRYNKTLDWLVLGT